MNKFIEKYRLAAFTKHENEALLNHPKVMDYYQVKKMKEKLEIAFLISNDLRKLGIYRTGEEIAKRLDNLKATYKKNKKDEEAYYKIKWEYYNKMKNFFE